MTGDAAHQASCQGCGTATTTAFQCPLCQAEGATDRGFFCTQECFAKNWMEHRNTLHKSGVVRERRLAAAELDASASAPIDLSRKGKKRAREAAAAQEKADGAASTSAVDVAAASCFTPWPALPSAAACAEHQWATVSPALALNVPRAVVRPASAAATTASTAKKKQQRSSTSLAEKEETTGSCMWAALLAAAQYTAASVQSDAMRQVLVVAGDVYSAHAFAWACRCVGLTGLMQLAVSNTSANNRSAAAQEERENDDSAAVPAKAFTAHKRVVIATSAVVRRSAAVPNALSSTAVSGAAALWLTCDPAHSLLITLPDVVEPEDLQGVQTRAVFFTGPHGTSDDEDEDSSVGTAYTYSNLAVQNEDGTPLEWAPVTLPAPGTSTTVAASAAADGEEDETSAAAAAAVVVDARELSPLQEPAARLDDEACTYFANGDISGALHHLVRRYQRQPGIFESTLFYVLCCNWGAAGLAHAHHRLAYIARFFADQSTRFEARKNATLVDAALRAVAAVVRLLPRMRDEVAEAAVASAAAAAAAAAAATTNATTSPNVKGSKRKAAKTEAAEVADDATAMPTLASTTRAVLPPVDGVSAPTAAEVARLANYFTHLPNLQLQATVCYLYDVASPAVLDTLAMAWGLHRFLPGPASLEVAARTRSAAVLRVRQRYTTKLDPLNANFYVVLMQLLYDAVGPYSLTVEEVRRRLLWDLTLAHDAGSLEAFLQSCALLPTSEGMLLPTAKKQKMTKAVVDAANAASSSSTGTALSSRQRGQRNASTRETPQSRALLLRCFAVKTNAPAEKNFGFLELPWKNFPITGERQRQIERLHRTAVEEVLMAMPRVPRPMYVGDIGNLIGKWAHFNSRFDGVLGATLQVFLEAHPDAFRVVDRLVTRRTAGTTEAVRIRFDGDEDGNDNRDDSDDEGRGRRRGNDRRLLTGANGKANVELPARARKKRELKAFNKERFNRNYKSIDASARVPGYVKHAPRRIKGRGTKANKRLVKRGN